MNCNNKTAKNKDSSIPDISNGQAVFLRGTVHCSLLKRQHLDTVITIKAPLLYPLLTNGTPLGHYREHSPGA